MNNHQKADRFYAEAQAILSEAQAAFGNRSWNLTIRRAQEVVELCLKGLLYEVGVDYPKVHDVAPVLVEALTKRQINVDQTFLTWLLGFSADLAAKRAPAFYAEAEFDQQAAQTALQGAARVLEFTKRFSRDLRTDR